MSIEDVRSVLPNWPWLVVAVFIVWPVVHFLYSHRITSLKEDLDRLRSRLDNGLLDAGRRHGVSEVERNAVRTQPSSTLVADSWGYPTFMDALPRAEGRYRVLLTGDVAQEIRKAEQALPPLDRDEGLRRAYAGRWMSGEGKIRGIRGTDNFLSVMVSDKHGVYYILIFPPSQRAQVESLREGKNVSFEGQIHELGRIGIELIYPTITEQ